MLSGISFIRKCARFLASALLLLAIASSVQSSFVANFKDDRILVEWCQHAFVGKVIRQVGTAERHGSPTTQFEVDVVLNIKGELAGRIVMSQTGGFQNGILYLLHGGDVIAPARKDSDPLLEPGTTYLFTSRFSTNDNWHTLMTHPNGLKLLSRDTSLDRVQLQALARRDEKVLKLQEAHRKNEAFYAEERSPITEALDRWLASYRQTPGEEEPGVDTRELDPILEKYSSQVAWVIAKRVEEGDPRLSEPRVHFGSIVALRRLGTRAAPAVPVLVRSLRQIRNGASVDWGKFGAAISILREIRTSSTALEDMLSLIPGPQSYLAFHFSIETLVTTARVGGAEVQPRLDAFLTHPDSHARLAAAVTLSRCFEPTPRTAAVIRESLEGKDSETTHHVLQGLKSMNGDKTVFMPHLLALLRNPNRVLATTAAQAIGEIGKSAAPTVLKCLSDDDPVVRKLGATALFHFVTAAKADPNTWPLVVSVIPNIAQDGPRQALWILRQCPDEVRLSPEVGLVLQKLAKSPETSVNTEAKRLLRQNPIPSAILR